MRFGYLSFIGVLVLTLGGCFSPPPIKTRSQADKEFLKICKEEYKLDVVIKPLQNTVWIYLPLRENFFDYKANQEKTKPEPKPKDIRVINFLDVDFKDRAFIVKYDISPARKYSKDDGYSSYYTEAYQAGQRNIITAVFRAYGSMDEIPGEVEFLDLRRQAKRDAMMKAHVTTTKPPDFFILVIADITRGIETRNIFYFPDIKRGNTDPSFYEEYSRRLIAEGPLGDKAIINDTTGEHLPAQELTWPEFLVKQIPHRIRFKYQQSDFPPNDDDAKEIAESVHAAVTAYSFGDFTELRLEDLGQNKKINLPKEALVTPGK